MKRLTVIFLYFALVLSGAVHAVGQEVYVARYKGDKACAISYTFDDGLAEHYTLVAPQLERRGFRGTFFINGSKINEDAARRRDTTRMTWGQLKELAERGHEIANCEDDALRHLVLDETLVGGNDAMRASSSGDAGQRA